VFAFALGVAIGFLEVVVALLQAYVFTLLTAQYISGALASEH
jgi:F-type H+-transporting ATPase subunit a